MENALFRVPQSCQHVCFLGGFRPSTPRKQTCWHDCGTRKSAFSISESLRIQLEALYAPSQRRFEDLIRAGRVADLS